MSTHPREVVVDVGSGSEHPASPATRAVDPASDARPARLPESPHRASRGADAGDPADVSATREGRRADGGTVADVPVDDLDSRRLEALACEAEGDASSDWDPVADATMAKILRGVSSTRSGRRRSARVAASFAAAAARAEETDAISIPPTERGRDGGRDARSTRREISRENDRSGDLEEGRLSRTARPASPSARPAFPDAPFSSAAEENARLSATKRSARRAPAAADDPKDPKDSKGPQQRARPEGQDDTTFSRRLIRSATRAFFAGGERPKRAGEIPSAAAPPGQSSSDDDGVPPIRLRRTSSYYVFAAEGASRRASFALAPCGVGGVSGVDEAGEAGDAASALAREQRARRRREELTRFRRRVADSGKLLASALAGLLAGVVLWAMTTATAQLTAAKFAATSALLERAGKNRGRTAAASDAFAAWAFYAGCAATCVGAAAFYVTRVAPAARGSGIPELKGYLNGNRQRGLFHWRTFLGRAVGICLVITATMPFGREGPSVHIGACAASAALNAVNWRARLGWQSSPEERRQILQLGSAAGVAAAFNAPIGGLLYVMEEVASSLPPDYVWRAMLAAGTAVGVAQILYAANRGRVDYSSLVISDPDSSTGWSPSDLPLIVLLAALAGAFSALFTRAADAFGAMRRGGGAKEADAEGDERAEAAAAARRGARGPETRFVLGFRFEAARLFRADSRTLARRLRAWYVSHAGAWCDAVLGAALVATAQMALPALFACRPAPEIREEYGVAYDGRRLLDASDEATRVFAGGRGLLSSAVYVPRTFVRYTCADGDFNEMATLMLQNEEGVVKHLFARDDLYSEELFSPTTVLAFLAYFFLAASLTFGGAFPAGVFIPNMLMGAALGRLFGSVAELVNSNAAPKGTYALIGSAAMLSGFTRMTAAVTVIIIEATASLDVLAPIILACVVSRATAETLVGTSLDEKLIVAKGVPFLEHDPHPSTVSMKIGDALREADARRGPVIAFRKKERLRVLLNALLLTEHNAFPVLEDVERNERVVGLVTRAMLQRVLRMVLEEAEAEAGNDANKSSESDDVSAASKEDVFRERLCDGPAATVSEAVVEIRDERRCDGRRPSKKNDRDRDRDPKRFSERGIDEWSVEGLGTPSRGSRESPNDPNDERETNAVRSLARRVFFACASSFPSAFSRGTRAHDERGDARKGPAGNKKDPPLSRRVGAAAAAADATPSLSRAGDANHFDELKENLVREIRDGAVCVPESQLRRMVDLTHAVDKAPWTADAETRLGRVHALFARLGVRHLCVTDDNGRRLAGVITRHDLIHVHRSAEGHA